MIADKPMKYAPEADKTVLNPPLRKKFAQTIGLSGPRPRNAGMFAAPKPPKPKLNRPAGSPRANTLLQDSPPPARKTISEFVASPAPQAPPPRHPATIQVQMMPDRAPW